MSARSWDEIGETREQRAESRRCKDGWVGYECEFEARGLELGELRVALQTYIHTYSKPCQCEEDRTRTAQLERMTPWYPRMPRIGTLKNGNINEHSDTDEYRENRRGHGQSTSHGRRACVYSPHILSFSFDFDFAGDVRCAMGDTRTL